MIQTGPIGHLKENANGILREVSALETVLASQQFDVACIQETKLQLMVKTPEIPQYRAVRRDRQIHWDARGGGLLIHALATLAFSAIYPTAGTSNVLEKLAMASPLQWQRKIQVNNWYLSSETTNFLQRVGFSDSEVQTELQQIDVICADLNAHDPLWDAVARPTEGGEFIGETILPS